MATKPGDTRKTYEALDKCSLRAAAGDRSDRETVQFTDKVNSLLPALHN